MIESMTFTSFVEVPENSGAFAELLAACESFGRELPVMFLKGPAGSGKSHLLVSFCTSMRENYGAVATYMSGREFFSNALDMVRTGSNDSEWLGDCARSQVLCIDDVDALVQHQSAMGILIDILERRALNPKAITVVSGVDLPWESDIALLPLRNAITKLKVIEVQPLSYESVRLVARVLLVRAGLPEDISVLSEGEWCDLPELKGRIAMLTMQQRPSVARVLNQ